MPLGAAVESLNNQEDYNGKFFLGTVVENLDPEGLDRIKATIPGIYDDIDSCQWMGPSKFSSFGEGLHYGVYGSPKIGSQVLVIFQDGDPHYPIYVGSLLLAGKKSESQKSEFHNEAWGFVDPTGNKLLVDMRTETLTFIHSTLVQFVIKEGTLNVYTPQDINIVVEGNITANVTGDVTATVKGSVSAEVTGNLTTHTQGETRIQAEGNTYVQGATVHLNGG